MIWIAQQLGVVEPTLYGNAIAGLFGFFGVLITGSIAIITWYLNQRALRQEKLTVRKEKSRDLSLAIWSEINAIWLQGLYTNQLKISPEQVTERFAEAKKKGQDYTPVVSSPPKSLIFESLKGESLLLMQSDEVADIARFYRHLYAMVDFAADLRNEKYAMLALDRKQSMLTHYLNMGDILDLYAEDCLTILEPKLPIAAERKMDHLRAEWQRSQNQNPQIQ